MKVFTVELLVILLGNTVYGEIRTLTLSNAISLALANNSEIARVREEIALAEAQRGEAVADFWMPSISANAGFTWIDPGTVENGMMNSFQLTKIPNPALDGLPIASDVLTNVYPDNYKTGVSISKTLFAGFRFWNALV